MTQTMKTIRRLRMTSHMYLNELLSGYAVDLFPSNMQDGIITTSYLRMTMNLNLTRTCSTVTIMQPIGNIPVKSGMNGMMRISEKHALRRTRIK